MPPNMPPIDTQTHLEKIDISDKDIDDLESFIKNKCDALGVGGYRLAGTFIFQTHLVLIFQKE